MADDGYNGWANYETWCMALWIDNDQGSYEYARELVDGTDAYVAAELLRDWQDDQRVDLDAPASVFTDLLSAAIGRVDWYEIARHYIEEDVTV